MQALVTLIVVVWLFGGYLCFQAIQIDHKKKDAAYHYQEKEDKNIADCNKPIHDTAESVIKEISDLAIEHKEIKIRKDGREYLFKLTEVN